MAIKIATLEPVTTWYELKKYLNELTGDQLGQTIITENSDEDFDREAISIRRKDNELKLVLS